MAMLAVGAAAYSWYNIASAPWISKCVFGASMIFSATSLCKASQQTRILLAISCCIDPTTMLRRQFGKVEAGRWLPSHTRIAAWQSSIVLLNMSILTLFAGFAALILGAMLACGGAWECQEAKVSHGYCPQINPAY